MKGITPRRFGNHPPHRVRLQWLPQRIVGEPMGRVADVRQSAPRGDLGSYDSCDFEVKMTRLATGALHRPQRWSKTRSGTSSKEAAHRLAAASRVKPGAGMSRDGRRSSA
jgi:hypothetical protein